MALVVGPGTPATVCASFHRRAIHADNNRANANDNNSNNDDDDDDSEQGNEEEEDDDDDDEEEEEHDQQASTSSSSAEDVEFEDLHPLWRHFLTTRQAMDEDDDDEDGDHDHDDDDHDHPDDNDQDSNDSVMQETNEDQNSNNNNNNDGGGHQEEHHQHHEDRCPDHVPMTDATDENNGNNNHDEADRPATATTTTTELTGNNETDDNNNNNNNNQSEIGCEEKPLERAKNERESPYLAFPHDGGHAEEENQNKEDDEKNHENAVAGMPTATMETLASPEMNQNAAVEETKEGGEGEHMDEDSDNESNDNHEDNEEQEQQGNHNNDDHDDGDDEEEDRPARLSRPTRVVQRRVELPFRRRRRLRRIIRSHLAPATGVQSAESISIRHGGCINTACWLDVPWRLSTVSQHGTFHHSRGTGSNSVEAVESFECPTQLITSGDDRLVKFWDVSGAMGMDNPLPGSWNTYCPFSTPKPPALVDLRKEWKNRYYPKVRSSTLSSSSNSPLRISGTVRLLASLSTGHRGNVFHVTPLPHQPGKVLTCGADGYLRMGDLVTESSSVIVHPYVQDEEFNNSPFVIHSGMAYSHTLLTAHTGLLCSDRGLHHFDIRLPPREQSHTSLLVDLGDKDETSSDTWRSGLCKACAVWSPHGTTSSNAPHPLDSPAAGGGTVESHYIFAGGASETVGLYDLRMDGSRGKVVERYKPHWLDTDGRVSVSGLDVSRDGRELLVSYESDQIYAFPILQSSSSTSGRPSVSVPTVQDIERVSEQFSKDGTETVSELAAYGSHLNRFTFLKNARYAGPNDEYICTGSDSGHAWFYERKTGTVAALLGADSSTCNGVIPHPTLPFFVTYGIDTTAKLWRATAPVDPSTDDSPSGRQAASLHLPYEMSPAAKTWDGVRALVNHFETEPYIMPDMIASSEEIAASGRFSSPSRRGMCGLGSPRIGNALQSLPMILRQNHYECYRAMNEEMDVPVEHPLIGLTHRVSLSRLRMQADRLGAKWNPWAPWAFEPKVGVTIHPADLVPDYPSDWINYDPIMKREVFHPRAPFNCTYYKNGLTEAHFPGFFDGKGEHDGSHPWLQADRKENEKASVSRTKSDKVVESRGETTLSAEGASKSTSRDILFQTVKLLKEGGNQAMKEGLLQTAARRYDKAIQYCAVAFMPYCDRSNLRLNNTSSIECSKNKVITNWTPLLQLLITSRLNMSLLLLKTEFSQPDRASAQALAALKLLSPFTVKKGKVIHIRDETEIVLKEREPEEHFYEAMQLKAKAFFRLGSGELAAGDYSGAVGSFEASLKCAAHDPKGGKPDALTVRRLQEAKLRQKNKKKRDRAKFQRLLCADEHDT